VASNGRKPPAAGKTTPKKGARFDLVGLESIPANAIRWQSVNAEAIRSCLDSVTSLGHAVSFARSRNGSTLSIVVLADDARYRWTADNVDEAVDLLLRVAEACTAEQERFD
jgi:hypothetical protein